MSAPGRSEALIPQRAARSAAGSPVSALTFNTVVAVLEREFHKEPACLRPDSTFGELGLDARSGQDFVMAVEDAFRLHIPAGQVDPGDAATNLSRLCETLEALSDKAETQRPNGRPATLAH